jgi:DnaJ-class molecular chaperone
MPIVTKKISEFTTVTPTSADFLLGNQNGETHTVCVSAIAEIAKNVTINNKGFCEHGRHRSQCKDCGGSGICEDGRRKSECKDCGGSGICEHGRQRSRKRKHDQSDSTNEGRNFKIV